MSDYTLGLIRNSALRPGAALVHKTPVERSANFYGNTPVAERRPLAEVAREQGQRLQALKSGERPARTERRQAARERSQAAVGDRTGAHRSATTATPAEDRRALFAWLDAMADALPVGCYALPRREDAGEGQSTYFFKIFATRKGNRIVGMTGGVGGFTEHKLSVKYQDVALTKIGADLNAAVKLFGDKTAHCGFCAAKGRTSPLTNDRSVAAGCGEHCAKANGVPW